MRSRLRLGGGVAAGLAVLLAFAWGVADSIRPYVTADRAVVASTPGLGALDTRFLLRLKAGAEGCVRPVTLTPESSVAQFRVLAPAGRPAPPLVLTARGDGYSAEARSGAYGTGGDQVLAVPFTAPERTTTGEVCLRNEGRTPVDLVGTEDVRSMVPAELLLDGEPVAGKDIELTLLEAKGKPLTDRPGQLVDRAHTLSSGFLPEWSLWVLLVLVALGFPLAIAGGLALSVRSD